MEQARNAFQQWQMETEANIQQRHEQSSLPFLVLRSGISLDT